MGTYSPKKVSSRYHKI
jgi:hypothetical protein